jgi:hypothetical protein
MASRKTALKTDRILRYVGPDKGDPRGEWESELRKLIDGGMPEPQATITLVERNPDLHRRYIDAFVNATAIVHKSYAFNTPPIARLRDVALALWPNDGEMCSHEFRGAVDELRAELRIEAAEWEATGEPMPRDRAEMEGLLALIGQSAVVAEGNWTPAGVAPMLIRALRRRERIATSDALVEPPTIRKKSERPSTNALMLDKLTSTPESHGWTIRKWSEEIKRSISSIATTPTWDKLKEAQAEAKATAALKRAAFVRPGRHRKK